VKAPDGYRIEPFGEQDAVSAADVIDLWTREGALDQREAERRISELILVATDSQGRLAAISTAYLKYHDQLRAELWHVRVFVSAGHRMVQLSRVLGVIGRDHLVQRYLSGEERRGIGLIYEIENVDFRTHISYARLRTTHFTFIGENARGDHVRVYYFPGALAPEPDQGST
jgi:hypothetical protein